MPSSLERLDSAYHDVMSASETNFFRRLLDYCRLLEEHRAIRGAVERSKAEVETARERFEAEDEQFTLELVACRNQLVVKAPEVDDSHKPKPRFEPLAPGPTPTVDVYFKELREWTMTLANFDAITAGSTDGEYQADGLDHSRSRMLGEILFQKIFRVRHPPDWNLRSMRNDLEELDDEVSDIHDRRISMLREWQDKGESTGNFPLQRLKLVTWYLETMDHVDPVRGDHVRSFLEAGLTDARGELRTLRGVLGPYGDMISGDATAEILGKYEAGCRTDLEALQVQLSRRIGGVFPPLKWWINLPQANRIAFGALAAAVVAIIVSIALH